MAETITENSQSLFIRHLAQDKLTRVQRKLRPTNKMGFLLGDGRRIRRKNKRTTEIDLKTLRENIDKLVGGVEGCYIEIRMADGGKPLTGDELKAMAGMKSEAPKTAEATASKVADAPAEAAAPEAAGPTFSVTVVASGGQDIQMLRAVREVSGLSVKDAADLLASGHAVKQGLSKENAEALCTRLGGIGGVVEMTEEPQVEPDAPTEPHQVDAPAVGETVIPAGKHQGKTLAALLVEDPEYYENLSRNLSKHPDIASAAVEYAELVKGKE